MEYGRIWDVNVNGDSNWFHCAFENYGGGRLEFEGIVREGSKVKATTFQGYVTYTVTYKGGYTETKTTKISIKVNGDAEPNVQT